MVIGFLYRWPGRRLFLAGLVLLPLLTGCQQGYPEEITYPLRSDLLVEKAPSNEVNEPEGPGEFDQTLRQLADAAKDKERPGTFKEGAGIFYDPGTLTAQERRDLEKALGTDIRHSSRPTRRPAFQPSPGRSCRCRGGWAAARRRRPGRW